MLVALFALLACTPEVPPEPSPEVRSAAPAPAEAPAEPADAPRGSIGGEPILPRPIVVGAITAEAVDAGIEAQMAAIRRCWEEERAKEPDLAGKVLVKFIIQQDGTVGEATTRSTSLRHASTEACVTARVSEASFPALERGRLAIVHYPFVFPPT